MEGVRIIPSCAEFCSQDRNGVIRFIDDRDILDDLDFVQENICASCDRRCEEEPNTHGCLRRELFAKVSRAVYLLNASMTDLYFGLWKGLYEREVKREYDRDNNS